MKININSKEILAIIQSVGGVINPKTTLPILENILFKSENGKLSVTGDNLELRATEQTEISVPEKFKACVNYDLLAKMLKGLPNVPIEMEFTEKQLSIGYANGLYSLPVVAADEYPAKVDEPEEILGKVNSMELLEALKRAGQFIDEKDTRLPLTGAHLKFTEDSVIIAGGSGSVLFETTIPAQATPGVFLLPKSGLNFLIGSISFNDEIEVKHSKTNAFFTIGQKKISAVLIDATYPDYQKIMESVESASDKKYNVDSDSLLPALRRLTNIADRDHMAVILDFIGSRLDLTYSNIEFAVKGNENLMCDYEGEALRIGFNPNFLIGAIANSDGPITMGLKAADKFISINGANSRCVIGPVKID